MEWFINHSECGIIVFGSRFGAFRFSSGGGTDGNDIDQGGLLVEMLVKASQWSEI